MPGKVGVHDTLTAAALSGAAATPAGGPGATLIRVALNAVVAVSGGEHTGADGGVAALLAVA